MVRAAGILLGAVVFASCTMGSDHNRGEDQAEVVNQQSRRSQTEYVNLRLRKLRHLDSAISDLAGGPGSSATPRYQRAADVLLDAVRPEEIQFLCSRLDDKRPSDKMQAVEGEYTVGMRLHLLLINMIGYSKRGAMIGQPDYFYDIDEFRTWAERSSYDLGRMRRCYIRDQSWAE